MAALATTAKVVPTPVGVNLAGCDVGEKSDGCPHARGGEPFG